MVIVKGLSNLTGWGVISVSISDDIINEVSCLQTIYTHVFIGRRFSPLKGRDVISVSLLDNIINEVQSLQKIYPPVYMEGTLVLEGAAFNFCICIGQYTKRSKKLTKNILTCG